MLNLGFVMYVLINSHVVRLKKLNDVIKGIVFYLQCTHGKMLIRVQKKA